MNVFTKNLFSLIRKSNNVNFLRLRVVYKAAEVAVRNVHSNVQELRDSVHSSQDVEQVNPNPCTPVKRYTETSYAHYILENSIHYTNVLCPQIRHEVHVPIDKIQEITQQDFGSSTTAEILKAFRVLSYYAHEKKLFLSNFQDILNLLKSKVADMNDDELRELMKSLVLWTTVRHDISNESREIKTALITECLKRYKTWTVDEMLLVCDMWFKLKEPKGISFRKAVLKRLGRKPKSMSSKHLVHYCCLLGIGNVPTINMYEIEYRFDECFNDLSIEEISIVAMGFFKTKTPLRNPDLVIRILKRTKENVSIISSISLGAIMKVIRYSTTLKEIDVLKDLLQSLEKEVPRLQFTTLGHIMHAAARTLIFNKNLTESILQKFAENVEVLRVKDLERIAYAMFTFNYHNNCPLHTAIIDDLQSSRRILETSRYVKCFPVLMQYLALSDVYPIPALQRLLSPEFIKDKYQGNHYKLGQAFFLIDRCLRVDVPDFHFQNTKQFTNSVLNYYAKKYGNIGAKASSLATFTSEIVNGFQEILGSDDAIYVGQLLPHFHNKDIIICLDEDNNPVRPAQYFKDLSLADIKYVPTSDDLTKRWKVFVLATLKHHFVGNRECCGIITAKIRQLQKIGYDARIIPYYMWDKKILRSEKLEYLKQQLYS